MSKHFLARSDVMAAPSDARDSSWVPVGPDEPFFHRFRAATQAFKNAVAGTIDPRARCLSAMRATPTSNASNCFSSASRFVLRSEEQGPLEQFIDGEAVDDDEGDSGDNADDDGPGAPEGDAEGVEGKDEVVDIAARGIRFRATLSASSYNGTSIGVVGRRTWKRLMGSFSGEGFCGRWADGDVQPPVSGSKRKQHTILKPGGAFLYSLEVLPGDQEGRLHVTVLSARVAEDLDGAYEGKVWGQTTFSDEDVVCAAVALDSIPYISVYGSDSTGAAPSMTVSDLEIIPLSTSVKSALKR
jgi:hypothetical protein